MPGTIPVRTQYVIEVKAQDSTIRMGGYYELSATGAVCVRHHQGNRHGSRAASRHVAGGIRQAP